MKCWQSKICSAPWIFFLNGSVLKVFGLSREAMIFFKSIWKNIDIDGIRYRYSLLFFNPY